MTSIGKLGAMQQLMKGGKMMPANVISDDTILVKKIVADHNPEGLDYDVKPLLHIVEDILRRSTLGSSEHDSMGELSHVDQLEDRTHLPSYTSMLEALSVKIDRISCEISYKILSGVDAHSTTVAIFEMLTIYKWDVKLVLALAAFALNYGEFWLLAHIHDTNQLAKSMAILKQLPGIMEHSSSLKPRFDTLNDLVNVILEVTKCVIEFNDLPIQYIRQDVSAYNTVSNHIPVAAYWSIRSIVACAAQITSLTTLGYEIFTSNDAWELSTLAFKLRSIVDHLRKQLDICKIHVEEAMDTEAYGMLRELFLTPHTDNMKIIKALIYSHDDILPLYDGVSKKRASLEALRRKNVLLLFSGLEFSTDELLILEQIYNESKAHAPRQDNRYELVWIPIVDQTSEWTDQKQMQFENLRESMPWFSVYHPSLISKAVVWFIQSEWKYKNKPILVVLDPQGRVACPNAIHMMWIWGSAAFPFTSFKEETLWKDETWRLELLVDGIDSEILNWIKEGKYIFLYGGDDPEWIKRFVKEARKVAQATRTPLEMVYVGKSNKRDQVQKVCDTIIREKLYTHSWSEQSMIWFFWTRLQSMLFSKIQLKQVDDNDRVMQEIKKLLSYDKQGGWIVLAKGSQIVVNGHASTGLQSLIEYDLMWKEHAERDGFETAFKEHYGKLHAVDNPCCRFEFSHSMGRIPDRLTCPECRRNMHVLTTFHFGICSAARTLLTFGVDHRIGAGYHGDIGVSGGGGHGGGGGGGSAGGVDGHGGGAGGGEGVGGGGGYGGDGGGGGGGGGTGGGGGGGGSEGGGYGAGAGKGGGEGYGGDVAHGGGYAGGGGGGTGGGGGGGGGSDGGGYGGGAGKGGGEGYGGGAAHGGGYAGGGGGGSGGGGGGGGGAGGAGGGYGGGEGGGAGGGYGRDHGGGYGGGGGSGGGGGGGAGGAHGVGYGSGGGTGGGYGGGSPGGGGGGGGSGGGGGGGGAHGGAYGGGIGGGEGGGHGGYEP